MIRQHQRLGYASSDRLLIVNADDFGMCRTYNATIERLLLGRAISSASLMVPCPAAQEAAEFCKAHPELDVGIHLTFTSEWRKYRWGPVSPELTHSSLTADDGCFYGNCVDFERHADPDEVQREITAQIERALEWGVQPTHLDIHMYSLLGLSKLQDFHASVLDACVRYSLPLRLARAYANRQVFSFRQKRLMRRWIEAADARGVVILDDAGGLDFLYAEGETYESVRNEMELMLQELKPGISEILLHPAEATDELRSFMPKQIPKREMEARLFTDDHILKVIADEGIRLIHWRGLCELQRREAPGRAATVSPGAADAL